MTINNTGPTVPLNPWVSIWLKPRETIRQILQSPQDKKREMLMLAVAGASCALGSITWDSKFDAELEKPIRLLIIGSGIVVGAAVTVILTGVFSKFAAFLFRKLFKGTASGTDFYRVYAWASIPSIVLFPFMLFSVLAFFPTARSISITPLAAPFVIAFGIAMMVLPFWQTVITIFGIAEAQKWGFWKVFLCIIGIGLLFALASLIIVLPVIFFAGSPPKSVV